MLQHDTVNRLQQAMGSGGRRAFQTVPKILINVIRDELWRDRLDREGKPFSSFEAFATAKLQQGLETSIDDLRAFCRRNDEALALIDRVIEPLADHGEIGGGHPGKGRGDTITSARGTSASYRRKRLKRDREDIYERFLAGELTLIAAEIEAGIKKPKTPLEAMQRDWERASPEQRRAFRKWIDAEAAA
jgi:hypothetical protein